MSEWQVVNGDCVEVMRGMPDCSVDAVVCDPPYELSFMSKSWDGTGIAYSVEMWAEVLRVLRPGGHLLAFGGTRTFHRMTVAIEDAGFQVRDCLSWLYGSGFPKSLNVGKAIDKRRDDREDVLRVTGEIARLRDAAGLTNRDLDGLFGFAGMASHWTSTKSQPTVPTVEQWSVLRERLEPPQWLDEEVWRLNGRKGTPGEAWGQREVVGERDVPVGHSFAGPTYGGDSSSKRVDVTAPATEEAARWEGWGTALKPAWEPVVLARKPLVGTVAANVLTHGTGALNIDGSRIASDDGYEKAWDRPVSTNIGAGGQGNYISDGSQHTIDISANKPSGRWPANVLLDEVAAGMLDEQAEASRFFYVAKASRRDRNEGVDGGANVHPTVKPTALMRHLVRLVTPPDGLVLDPFCGSGSTGKAAVLEGFRFVGIEQDPDYAEIARRRIAWAEEQEAEQPDQQRLWDA